jgi:hypothetical protein
MPLSIGRYKKISAVSDEEAETSSSKASQNSVNPDILWFRLALEACGHSFRYRWRADAARLAGLSVAGGSSFFSVTSQRFRLSSVFTAV